MTVTMQSIADLGAAGTRDVRGLLVALRERKARAVACESFGALRAARALSFKRSNTSAESERGVVELGGRPQYVMEKGDLLSHPDGYSFKFDPAFNTLCGDEEPQRREGQASFHHLTALCPVRVSEEAFFEERDKALSYAAAQREFGWGELIPVTQGEGVVLCYRISRSYRAFSTDPAGVHELMTNPQSRSIQSMVNLAASALERKALSKHFLSLGSREEVIILQAMQA